MTSPSIPRILLPAQPTPFIGRESERQQIAALLIDPAVRVLTLVGIGGVGKTRLALAAAETAAPQFPAGVVFVPLSPLHSEVFIPDALAKALDIAVDAPDPSSALIQVGACLRGRRALILLDNFEHVIDAAPMVQELALTAPHITLLVTSRERLSIRAEQVCVVEGMAMRDDVGDDFDQAVETDPVRLFISSASRTNADFTFTPDDLPAFRRICTLVGGVPLGLELAASWVDALSLDEIAAEIQRGLDFLETSARDIPERQRSLRAAFDYSWRCLSSEEQGSLSRLAIFNGGFSRRAAVAVAGVDLRMLQNFINKSLLRRVREDRYEIHEVLRAFATSYLEAAGEAEATRAAHSRYYMERLRIRESDVKGNDQLAGLDAIDLDFENFRAAWANALDRHDWGALDAGLECLFWYCLMRSRYRDGDAVFALAENAEDARFARRTRLRRLWLKRWASGKFNPLKGEVVLVETALRDAITDGDVCEAAVCRVLLGDAMTESDPISAAEYLNDARDAFEGELADPFYAAWALHFMAKHAGSREGIRAAIPLHQECLRRRRSLGDRAGENYALFNLAFDQFRSGSLDEAAETAEMMQAASHAIGERSGVLMSSVILALIAYVRDDLDEALSLNAFNRRLSDDLNHRLGSAYCDLLDMLLADVMGVEPVDHMASMAQRTVAGDMQRIAMLVMTMRAGKMPPPADRAAQANESLLEPLTDRELEILQLLGEGLNNNEIADRLVVGLSTVKKHITHLYGKLDVTTRTQAILKGQELGLIE